MACTKNKGDGIIKRIITVVALFAITALLVGCATAGGKVYQVKHVEQQHVKNAAKRAVELSDQYLTYEISSDDFDKEIEEVKDRVGDFSNYDFGTPEYNVSYAISSLTTATTLKDDAYISEQRDIIAVYIGIAPTGEIYRTPDIWDMDNLLDVQYKYDGLSSVSVSDADDSIFIMANFDVSHNYTPAGVEEFCKTIDTGLLGKNYLLYVSIDYYRQSILHIYIHPKDGVPHVNILMSDEDNTSGDNNDEEDSLPEFEISDIEPFLNNIRILK